jgi:PAS domain S-box-containing protein
VRLAILLLAVLLQASAAVLALRMIRITGHLPSWILLSGALVLMAVRRVIGFVQAEWGHARADTFSDGLGLAVSTAMLASIWLIKDHFESTRERERRLEEVEHTARTLLENAADAVEILDLEGRFLEVNRAACEKLGYRREELIGGTPAVLDSRMDEAAIREVIGKVVAQGELVFETVHRTRDGFEFPVEIHATPVTYRGRPALMSLVRDITERKRHEEIQRNARKVEGLVQMASGVAHDFNNLFQVVLANLELARTLSIPASKATAHLDRARAALERAGTLAQRIQQFSGGVLRVVEPTDLNEIAASVRDGIDLWRDGQWDLSPDLPRVPLDPNQLRMVVEAVLTNAWEAGPPVRVRTYLRSLSAADVTIGAWAGEPGEGEYAVIEVEDHGHGIRVEELPRLYDPFYSTKGVGRGLGLAATLGLVKGHGGAIQVVSAPGFGTAVRLHFPLAGSAVKREPTIPAAP